MTAGPGGHHEAEYTVLASTPVFRGRVISVRTDEVRMSDGSVARREIVEHPGAVAVVAIDEQDQVVLVHQYRHPVREYLYELPAGLLDVAGESALTGAKRELFEEAGLHAQDWWVLVDLLTSPGMTDEAIRIYLARGLSESVERFTPEHEEITMTLSRVPLTEAVRRIQNGEISNAAACAGLLAAAASRAAGWGGLRPAESPWPARPGR